ncbi:MAG: DEAD/DEAH box helicase family protein [Candidatus Thermoplasmatota archaeon]|nr:DEAD/DEAH box helicase family protein [Candidatus Thermoplasmatota archaeon]
MDNVVLRFQSGTLVADAPESARIRHMTYDIRTGVFRALAYQYPDIIRDNGGIKDQVFPDKMPVTFSSEISLRDYQRVSLRKWKENGCRGIVVLPTAAGKTHIGLAAMEMLKTSTIVIAPTIDLIEQWKTKISQVFGIEVGQIGGGEDDLKPITVCTYDSAYLRAESLGGRFRLMIVDEVHHLSAEKYMEIAKLYAAPFRLGLTATLERNDGLHEQLPQYMGGKVFELGYEELTDFLSNYEIVRVPVSLTDSERQEYERNRNVFVNYLRRHRMALRGTWDFERFILSSWNPEGREALLAWRRAREIAFSSRTKIETTRSILSRHVGEKTIIFSEDTETAYLLSRTFLIPAITYLTSPAERREYLEWFRQGRVRSIATSRVLDEGVDVPDASIAIVLSGSGSMRQFRQRLGRILRPSHGKMAFLYEVVASGTSEYGTSSRRRKGVPVGSGPGQED